MSIKPLLLAALVAVSLSACARDAYRAACMKDCSDDHSDCKKDCRVVYKGEQNSEDLRWCLASQCGNQVRQCNADCRKSFPAD